MEDTVDFHPEARDEAVEAAAYIARHGSTKAALRWYEGLEAAIASLSRFPTRCALAREHGAFPGVELRQLVFHSHRLLFVVRRHEVHVLHLRHAARSEMGSDDAGE